MSTEPYGPLIGPEDVLQAALRTLKAWTPSYLSNLETKHGLAANTLPRPKSYHGGVDDRSWIGEVLPEVMLLVSPLGEPERPEYVQCYLIDTKVACKGDQTSERAEDEARVSASYLGTALMLLVQQADLGGLAQDTIMVGSPTLGFPDQEFRHIVAATVRFHTWIGSIIDLEGPTGTVPQEGEEGGGGEQLGPPVAPIYKAEKASVTVQVKP